MYIYTVTQWVLFFYFYCFVGWIWESSYVSIKQRKWVNRGFMHGPFLPIYGSGAIIILLATIPVKQYYVLIFLFGMIAATVLEYITGVVMERLFHVRYWDYSGKFMNVKGHICLGSSLTWGAFSILLIKVIHVPVEHMILAIPDVVEQGLTYLLTIVIASDFAISFMQALDFKRMLESLTENSEEIQRIQKRLEVIAAFAGEDIEQLMQTVSEKREISKEKRENAKVAVEERLDRLKECAGLLVQKVENYCGEQPLKETYEELKKHALRLKRLSDEDANRFSRVSRPYQVAKNILKRNPVVAEQKYKEALRRIREKK